MRPIRLEMEGFTSFRDRTEVDFSDTELFVLTGPTGAGKSSVIDAITFALYGSVPRLDDRKAVAPVMSQGVLETKVRLDFSVAERKYSAVRVLRMRSGKVTTAEARLEDDQGNTLAGSERELSKSVEKLLGLPFDHFTKCVVLPQGDFADFLHEEPRKRQDLLVRLLGIDLYGKIAKMASGRASEAKAQTALLEDQLSEVEKQGVSEEAIEEGRKRIAELQALKNALAARKPQEEAQAEQVRDVERQLKDVDEGLALLKRVKVPAGVEELDKNARESREATAAARKSLDEAVEKRGECQKRLGELPGESDLRLGLKAHDDLAKERTRLEKAGKAKAAAEKSAAKAEKEATEGREALEQAAAAIKAIENENSAFHLAQGLRPGDVCPVCQREVEELPALEMPEAVEVAQKAHKSAEKKAKKLVEVAQEATSDLARREQSHEEAARHVADLEEMVEGGPAREELADALELVQEVSAEVKEAESAAESARKALKAIEAEATAIEETEKKAWRRYRDLRDQIGAMSPPKELDDLLASWNELLAWATDKAGEQQTRKAQVTDELGTVRAALDQIRTDMVALCEEAGVEVGDEDPAAACSRDLGRQEARVTQLGDALRELKEKQERLEETRGKGQVAEELARQLGARNFERWLLGRVLAHLCRGATLRLEQLSSGAYALALDERNNFVVIDHRNADERRSVKTLSGGETFLASLCLALALSEHLGEVAMGGAAKLEALFLDEGFGTLDAETLDVVTAAVEELGAQRMVGIVTHVKELAERMPVRFEVTKEGNRSRVERVAA